MLIIVMADVDLREAVGKSIHIPHGEVHETLVFTQRVVNTIFGAARSTNLVVLVKRFCRDGQLTSRGYLVTTRFEINIIGKHGDIATRMNNARFKAQERLLCEQRYGNITSSSMKSTVGEISTDNIQVVGLNNRDIARATVDNGQVLHFALDCSDQPLRNQSQMGIRQQEGGG